MSNTRDKKNNTLSYQPEVCWTDIVIHTRWFEHRNELHTMQYWAAEDLLFAAPASYLAALFLPEDGRLRVSCSAALEGDAPPLGGNLVSGLRGNLRWYWRRERSILKSLRLAKVLVSSVWSGINLLYKNNTRTSTTSDGYWLINV